MSPLQNVLQPLRGSRRSCWQCLGVLYSAAVDVNRASRNQCFVPSTVGAQITWGAAILASPEKGGSAM